MGLSNKYLSIKHHVKIKTINYYIIQCFYIIIVFYENNITYNLQILLS